MVEVSQVVDHFLLVLFLILFLIERKFEGIVVLVVVVVLIGGCCCFRVTWSGTQTFQMEIMRQKMQNKMANENKRILR